MQRKSKFGFAAGSPNFMLIGGIVLVLAIVAYMYMKNKNSSSGPSGPSGPFPTTTPAPTTPAPTTPMPITKVAVLGSDGYIYTTDNLPSQSPKWVEVGGTGTVYQVGRFANIKQLSSGKFVANAHTGERILYSSNLKPGTNWDVIAYPPAIGSVSEMNDKSLIITPNKGNMYKADKISDDISKWKDLGTGGALDVTELKDGGYAAFLATGAGEQVAGYGYGILAVAADMKSWVKIKDNAARLYPLRNGSYVVLVQGGKLVMTDSITSTGSGSWDGIDAPSGVKSFAELPGIGYAIINQDGNIYTSFDLTSGNWTPVTIGPPRKNRGSSDSPFIDCIAIIPYI